MKKKAESTLCLWELILSPALVFFGHGYLHYGIPERNGSHRLGFHLYFNLNDVQHKHYIVFAYSDPAPVGAITEAHGETVKMVAMNDHESVDMKNKESASVPEMRNYFISYEISNGWPLVP